MRERCRVYKVASSQFGILILVLGHVLSPVRSLPRHSLLLIANYTSEPVCRLRSSAIFGKTYSFLALSRRSDTDLVELARCSDVATHVLSRPCSNRNLFILSLDLCVWNAIQVPVEDL